MGLAAEVFIVGFAFQTVSMNYAMLVVARLISAIAVGMLSVISPIYISESCRAELFARPRGLARRGWLWFHS